MSCPSCDRLRAELADARDEIAEWERQADERPHDQVALERQVLLRQRFGISVSLANMLQQLLIRSPLVVTKAELFKLRDQRVDEALPTVIGVNICKLRDALETHGAPRRLVETVWHAGYRISVPNAALIERLVAELRP